MNPCVIDDPETQARAMRLRRMMSEFLANQTPQERDRMMQFHLAQAQAAEVPAPVAYEDTILVKLSLRCQSRSEPRWNDALYAAQLMGARLNWKYLFDEARSLGIEDDLIHLRDEAGI